MMFITNFIYFIFEYYKSLGCVIIINKETIDFGNSKSIVSLFGV